MDKEKHKANCLNALKVYKGDDYARAKLAFGHMTNEELIQPHGDSGVTRAELLRRYADWELSMDATIEWVRSLP